MCCSNSFTSNSPCHGGAFWKMCGIDMNVQFYKNVPRMGYFVKTGRCFVYEMKTPEFARTNLLMDPRSL